MSFRSSLSFVLLGKFDLSIGRPVLAVALVASLVLDSTARGAQPIELDPVLQAAEQARVEAIIEPDRVPSACSSPAAAVGGAAC